MLASFDMCPFHFHSYWSDAGPRSVATRGFAMKQLSPEVTIDGVGFDPDTLRADALGDTPFWMTASVPLPQV
jgi:hypothetical protein